MVNINRIWNNALFLFLGACDYTHLSFNTYAHMYVISTTTKRGRGDYISAREQKLCAFKIVTFINDTEHWN